MTWALKRQIFYICIVVLFFIGMGYLLSYPYIHQAPSCTDAKQNGDETGVDCGGSCLRACLVEQNKIAVLWSRAFEVVPGRYNAVAYIENKNESSAINKINYRFRFADKDNVYIGKREGSTFIPPKGKFAIFEPAIDIGNSVPVYTTFEFTEAPNWLQVDPEKVNQLKVFSADVKLENEDTAPKLSAVIRNNSLYTIPNLGVVAVLYDKNHNALAISKTTVSELKGQASEPIYFTWPQAIPAGVVYKELIPIYNIFGVSLK